MTTSITIQNVIFPQGDELEQHYDLFYHAPRCVVTPAGSLLIPMGCCLDFAAYLNGVPLNKWRQYTDLDNLTLVLRARGHFVLKLTSYTLEPLDPVRKVLAVKELSLPETGQCCKNNSQEYCISYPLAGAGDYLAFEIDALSTCELLSARFETQRAKEQLREVNLVLSTTTCRKEKYVTGNVRKLRESILEAADDMKEHFYINVVDNGKTLQESDLGIVSGQEKTADSGIVSGQEKAADSGIVSAQEKAADSDIVSPQEKGTDSGIVSNQENSSDFEIVRDKEKAADSVIVSDEPASHIRLIPNNNTGGSGGFARGMIEALHMDAQHITHILLMDDDVLILPESIRRTYTLLRMVKPKYQNAMISGAMMEMDAMFTMHEDIGTLLPNKDFFHVKPIRNEKYLADILRTNQKYPRVNHDYCGWWYCCIPLNVIRQNGLPLPLFIRGDDVEYGIRCKVPFMTMTGICVWHMGFANKFSNATNLYQEFRNIFLVKDITCNIEDVDILSRWKQEMMRALLIYNYKGAEALCLAMEDYLKGPSFIEQDHAPELLKRNAALNERMKPIPEDKESHIILERVYEDKPLSLAQRALYYKSWNGQLFPAGKLDPTPAIMGFDWAHQPGKTAFHEAILSVNPLDRTYCLRHQDRSRFMALYQRYEKDLKRYEEERPRLRQEYHADFGKMTSEAFWRKYLQLDVPRNETK